MFSQSLSKILVPQYQHPHRAHYIIHILKHHFAKHSFFDSLVPTVTRNSTNLESCLLDSDQIVVTRSGKNFVLTTAPGDKTGRVLVQRPPKVAPTPTAKIDQSKLVQRISKDCGE